MLVIISKILLSSFFAWGVTNSYELAKSRCAPPEENEKVIYSSSKRFKDRTYFRNGQFVLFYDLGLTGKLPVILTERLINSVTTHIQEAHRQGYIDFVFFPDMGHSHLMIPENFYREQIKDFPVKEINKAYEKMLGHPELRILYHTA